MRLPPILGDPILLHDVDTRRGDKTQGPSGYGTELPG